MAVTWISNKDIPYEQWRINRRNSIGASEVGTIIFGSRWTSNLEIWMDKVVGLPAKVQNLRMFLGNETEDTTAKMWSYYDKTEQSVVDNIMAGNQIKKCYNKHATAVNSKWPFLTVTPDRIIEPFGKYAGRKTEGCLELKNSQSYVINSYQDQLPPENVVQTVTQMMVTEFGYSEICYFLDNARLSAYELELNQTKSLQKTIIEQTSPFWDSVLAARKIHNQIYEAKRTYNFKLATELEIEMAKLEPNPQSTAGYLSFLTERYRDRVANIGMVKGDTDQLMLAREHRKTCAAIKKQEQKKMELEIKLKLAIKENVVLDFGKDGRLSYYPNKNGNRILNTKLIK